MGRRAARTAGIVALGVAVLPAVADGRVRPAPVIQVLSNRADLISSGDVLVAVRLPRGTRPSRVRVYAGSRNVTRAFARRANRRYEGLVTRLRVGRTVLRVRAPGAREARVAVINHPNGGPVFAGPQVKPWVCEDGARDSHCNRPTTFSYQYMSSSSGTLQPYDPKNPPPDVATTHTQTGANVPFIVRTETGYQDRDQYQIATLFQPGRPWRAWSPQRQFNHKLLITHGFSCGIDHKSAAAPSVTSDVLGSGSPATALGLGFAVMSTALDNAGHNCNHVTMAESLVMAKEHLIERYGTLRYTIGTGCSGGSLAQHEVANSYPGVYQGILPQCSFPDNWSTGQQLADYHLDRAYLENPAKWATGVVWTPAQIAAVEGHPNHANAYILDSLYWTSLGDPTNACAGVTDAQRYDPQSHPSGVRCTLADYMINVFGPRPRSLWIDPEKRIGHGFAGRAIDNVGVQYGLNALKQGLITPSQFADLNAKIGGSDIDLKPVAQRVAADEPALRRVYESGGINETNNLRDMAIIDLRGSDDGAFHDAYRAFAVRARLDQQNHTHANQVIWQGPAPLIGQTDFTTKGLLAMDRWLSGVERDRRRVALSRKVREHRPPDIHDECFNGAGQRVPDESCVAVVRVYQTPRMVAGESVRTDVNKCRLKPLRRSDYTGPLPPTDADWSQLRSAFPGGVCDWTKRGVDQRNTIPWRTYQGRSGRVVYGGRSLGRPPGGSGSGWSASVFADPAESMPGSVPARRHR
ncbi:MAG: hypothetical protein QOK31_8 [Solirubrobacteraceae bacterium]|nr:hypothetical protein [Solirubrobacteraceae bacterium]